MNMPDSSLHRWGQQIGRDITETDFQEKKEKWFYFFQILSTITPHLWTKKDFTWCHNLANYFLKGRSNILPFDQ